MEQHAPSPGSARALLQPQSHAPQTRREPPPRAGLLLL